jgi:hypothetical protein
MELTQQEIQVLKGLVQAIAGDPWVPSETSIFCNPQHPGGLWSMPGVGEGSYVDCPSDCLKGRITRLWYTSDEQSIRMTWHLKVMNGDRIFVIHSNHDRGFSRSMLGGIAMMSEAQLSADVIIQCKTWKAAQGMMQFCTFHASGEMIDAPKITSDQIGAIARTAQELVAKVNGYEYDPSARSRQAA